MAEPAAERLVGQAVKVLPKESLITVQRELQEIFQRHERHQVNHHDEKPCPADSLRPGSDARGKTGEQNPGRNKQFPEHANTPKQVPAPIKSNRLFARFGTGTGTEPSDGERAATPAGVV